MSVKIKVSPSRTDTIRIGQTNAVRTLKSDRVAYLRELLDVDLDGVTDGSILIYEPVTNKFVATNTLTAGTEYNFDIDGGEF